MQLLTHVYSWEERARIESLLNERGIPTYARSTGVGRGFYEASKRWAIFVCLNAQLDDAIALLKDPDHDVAEPVNVSEFNEAIESVGTAPIVGWAVGSAAFFVVLFCAMLYVLWQKYNA